MWYCLAGICQLGNTVALGLSALLTPVEGSYAVIYLVPLS